MIRRILLTGLVTLASCGLLSCGSPSSNSGEKAPDDVTKSSSTLGLNPNSGIKIVDGFVVAEPKPPFKLVEINDPKYGLQEVWQSRGEPGKYGGTLTMSTFGSGPKTFNCWAAADALSSGIAGELLYDSLIDTDVYTGETYPRLAKSIEIGPDKKTYTVKLRKGLRWSDGQPITADDVIFSVNTIVAKGFGNPSARDVLSAYDKFPTVEKIDDLTVRFHTQITFAPFLHGLSNIAIAPKHILEPVTKKPIAQFGEFWNINCKPETLVTSGPFRLSRYVPGQRVEFVRSDTYSWVDKENRKLPYLDKVVVAIVPDQNTEILKFYGHEIDMLDVNSVKGLDAALMKQREKSGNFTMYNLGPDDGKAFLMFNLNRRKTPDGKKYYVDPIKSKWFNNLYFRNAINHALDRDRIVKNVLRGVGMPSYICEPPTGRYVNKDLKPFPQDLNYAQELLKKGGFEKKGDVLYDSDGHRVEFTLQTNAGNTIRDAICIIIKNELQKLGMKVNYQPVDFNILIDKIDNSRDWEAMVMALTGNKIEPYDGANTWKSNGRLHMFDLRNIDDKGHVNVTDARDWEKKIDELFDKAATTLDEKERTKYFHEYQKVVYDNVPFIYLYNSYALTAVPNNIGNYSPSPLVVRYPPLRTMHNIEEIYFTDSTASAPKESSGGKK